MRVIGFACVLVLSATPLLGQPLPPAAPPAAPPAPAADAALDIHLSNWEKTLSKPANFSAEFELTRTEATFKKERKYTGQILCMKPNFGRFSIASTTDKGDFEAYICNGKSLFEYNWPTKTITEIPLEQGQQADNLMLDFISGMSAAAAKKRFVISQFNPADKNYVYLDIKPTLTKDKLEFEHIRFALYGPEVPAQYKPYLPAKMYMVKPNGDSEMWSFSKQAVDVPGIEAKHFQYEEPKDGKSWIKKKAPPPPAAGPMAPMGGAVRPTIPQK